MTDDNNESVFGCGRFDEQDNNKFLKFTDENNTLKYKFLEDEPEVKLNKFKTEQFTFEVLNSDTEKVMSHSITSRRYMRLLEAHRPLSGKEFCVHRKGEGMETDYDVVLL